MRRWDIDGPNAAPTVQGKTPLLQAPVTSYSLIVFDLGAGQFLIL